MVANLHPTPTIRLDTNLTTGRRLPEPCSPLSPKREHGAVAERLEIAFIEVAPAECGRGIGTQAVRALEQRHRDRQLLAYSEEADGFWASLGWEPFHHPDGDWRTLFIQPARSDLEISALPRMSVPGSRLRVIRGVSGSGIRAAD